LRLDQAGAPAEAPLLAAAGAAADVLVGAGIAVRATARRALRAGLALSALYLAAGTVLAPALWADPLGPLLKILPVMALSLAALAIADDR
jgi:DoxX-like family